MRIKMPKIKQIKFMKTILSQTSQRKLAKELNMSRTGVRRWLSGDNFLPLEAFNILTKKYNLTNYKKYIKKTLPDNWGRKKGGKSNIKKISDLKSYMKRLHENHRKKSRKVKHITEIEFTTPFGLMVKEQKLDPHPFIATMLLTDGHMCLKKNCYEIGYASKNNYELNKIFIELVKLWNNEIVISEYTKNNGVIINYFHLPLQNKLIKISPSYKKSPSKNQTSDEYLRKSQPSLNFLKKLDDVYKILCIRIALSNEGGISVTTKMNKNQTKLIPRLFLSCAHPKLNSEWKSILKDVGLYFNTSKSKQTWSGVYGLYTTKKDNIKFFQELGGFIEGVKVKQNSKYYGGVEKNKLLKLCIQNSKFRNIAEVKDMLGP